MKQVRVISVLLVLFLTTIIVSAGEITPADFALTAVPEFPEVALGSSYSVTVLLSSKIDGVEAWSFGLCIDTSDQAILEAKAGDDLNFVHFGNSPEYQVIKIWPDKGVTEAIVLDLQGESSLKAVPEEEAIEVLKLELKPDKSATGKTVTTTFCNEVGEPPVETLFVVGNEGFAPATQKASEVSIVRDPQTLIAFKKDFYNLPLSQGSVNTILRIRSTFKLYGFSFGLQNDQDLLKLDSAEFLPDLNAAIGDKEPDFKALNILPSGLTAGVVFDMTPPEADEDLIYIQSNTDNPSVSIINATYSPGPQAAAQVAASDNGQVASELKFTDQLGNPPVEIIFDLGKEHIPNTRDSEILITETPLEVSFIRGDVNGDGHANLADVINLLRYLFGTPLPFSCMEALDCNDDAKVNESGDIVEGGIDLADAIYLLSYLFIAGPELNAPFHECAPLPAGERNLGCVSFPFCSQ